MAKAKTKAELLEEIKELKAEIKKFKEYQTEYDSTASVAKALYDSFVTASAAKSLYDSFVKAGFTEEQSILILVNFFKKI